MRSLDATQNPLVIGKGWAILHPDGRIYVDANMGATEDDTWRIALGYPTRGEVREAKESGARAIRVMIVEVKE